MGEFSAGLSTGLVVVKRNDTCPIGVRVELNGQQSAPYVLRSLVGRKG